MQKKHETTDRACPRCGARAGDACISQRQQYGTHGDAPVPVDYRNRRVHDVRKGHVTRKALEE